MNFCKSYSTRHIYIECKHNEHNKKYKSFSFNCKKLLQEKSCLKPIGLKENLLDPVSHFNTIIS